MFKINFSEVERLQKAMKDYAGDTETAINEVLHGEAGNLAQEEIFRLMPVSGRKWRGKAPAAKQAKSLRNLNGNLSVTVTTNKKWQYLYFPDDGASTRRHVGNQQFFSRGGEAATDEIIDRCINKLITNFESEV